MRTHRCVKHRAWMFALLLFVVPGASSAGPSTPSHIWSERFGAGWFDEARSVAVDASGNVYVTGFFHDTVNFGGSPLTSLGSKDVFLAKYSASGVHVWSQRLGGSNADDGVVVTVDPSGNVIVAGDFAPPASFGGATLTTGRIFIAKFDTNGAHQWSLATGVPSLSMYYANVTGLSADASGSLLVTGYFAGTVTIGGVLFTGVGSDDIFLAKYLSNGTPQWAYEFGSGGSDRAQGVAVDASGNAFVTGHFDGSIGFGGATLVSHGVTDAFLAKFNTSGAHVWSQGLGGFGFETGNAVAVDPSGNVVITGSFDGSTNLGGSNITPDNNYRHVFLAKYNPSGVHQWSQGFPGTANDEGLAVAVDGSGNIAITGSFGTIYGEMGYTINFGGATLASNGMGDIFVAKFGPNGVHQWSGGFGGTAATTTYPFSDDAGRDVAMDPSGNVLFTGLFRRSITFLGSPLVSAGENDIFLAKYGPEVAEPAIQSIVDVGNDQGRHVKIAFGKSGVDGAGRSIPVVRYEAYRRDDPPPAAAAPVTSHAAGAAVPARGQMDQGWQFVGSVPAHGETAYLLGAPTIADSTISNGPYNSAFFIRAVTDDEFVFYDSPIDSGYSLDNLVPGVPGAFAYNAGQLSWETSREKDFDHFTVYGANANSFALATVVDYSVAPAMDVSASPYAFYFVTATDHAGNEGKPATVNTLSGMRGTPGHYVLSVSNYPNPFNPRTTVSYTVPDRGAVTVAIYDARGERIATLVNHETRPTGAYTIEWDGRSDEGTTASSGVYFARIEQNGATLSKKITLLK